MKFSFVRSISRRVAELLMSDDCWLSVVEDRVLDLGGSFWADCLGFGCFSEKDVC